MLDTGDGVGREGRYWRDLRALRRSLLHSHAEDENISAQGRQSRSSDLMSNLVDGKFVRDQSIDRSEAAQVTGGSRGALDSVVSTENGRSVLLSSEAPLGRDLHNLDQMIGEVTDQFLVIHPPIPKHRRLRLVNVSAR